MTAIQGAGQSADTTEALVRNVDKAIFGKQVGRAAIDLPGEPTPTDPDGFGLESFNRILDAIEIGEVSSFYVHLAEGQAANELSRNELDKLVRLKGLTPATVIIHGTALTEDQLGDIRDAKAKLVWSPQSNLRLYGETTLADKALAMKLPLALGADWLPSGSTSLLAEMKVARHWLAGRGKDIGAEALVQMVTKTAATIAGLADRLGRLDAERPADLAVFERSHEDPWESVAQSTPAEVNLVMIGGDVAYIREDWLEGLGAEDHQDHLERALGLGQADGARYELRRRQGGGTAAAGGDPCLPHRGVSEHRPDLFLTYSAGLDGRLRAHDLERRAGDVLELVEVRRRPSAGRRCRRRTSWSRCRRRGSRSA